MTNGQIPLTVSDMELAALFGVHRHTVGQWRKAGLPSKPAGRVREIDLGVACRWIRARDAAIAKAERDGLKDQSQRQAAITRKVVAEARLSELEVEERTGALVQATSVGARWDLIALALKEGVLALAPRAVQAGLIPIEGEEPLARLCRDVLRELSRPA